MRDIIKIINDLEIDIRDNRSKYKNSYILTVSKEEYQTLSRYLRKESKKEFDLHVRRNIEEGIEQVGTYYNYEKVFIQIEIKEFSKEIKYFGPYGETKNINEADYAVVKEVITKEEYIKRYGKSIPSHLQEPLEKNRL